MVTGLIDEAKTYYYVVKKVGRSRGECIIAIPGRLMGCRTSDGQLFGPLETDDDNGFPVDRKRLFVPLSEAKLFLHKAMARKAKWMREEAARIESTERFERAKRICDLSYL